MSRVAFKTCPLYRYVLRNGKYRALLHRFGLLLLVLKRHPGELDGDAAVAIDHEWIRLQDLDLELAWHGVELQIYGVCQDHAGLLIFVRALNLHKPCRNTHAM